jgi:undecaprenyl-diphosphatase
MKHASVRLVDHFSGRRSDFGHASPAINVVRPFMSDYLAAVILGLVEGLTEFIPVSSTGHLLLTKVALGLTDPSWDSFIVLIQLGAILAVVALYFQRLWKVLIGLPTRSGCAPLRPERAGRLHARRCSWASCSTTSSSRCCSRAPALICWSLIIGGVVLLAIDRWSPAPKEHDAMKLPLLTSLGVGVIQCLAMIPGVSRSGATIVGGVHAGRRQAGGGGVQLLPGHPDHGRRLRQGLLGEPRRA